MLKSISRNIKLHISTVLNFLQQNFVSRRLLLGGCRSCRNDWIDRWRNFAWINQGPHQQVWQVWRLRRVLHPNDENFGRDSRRYTWKHSGHNGQIRFHRFHMLEWRNLRRALSSDLCGLFIVWHWLPLLPSSKKLKFHSIILNIIINICNSARCQ